MNEKGPARPIKAVSATFMFPVFNIAPRVPGPLGADFRWC
jgi:hypothetical protein